MAIGALFAGLAKQVGKKVKNKVKAKIMSGIKQPTYNSTSRAGPTGTAPSFNTPFGDALNTPLPGDSPMHDPCAKKVYSCEEKCAYGRMMKEKCSGCRPYRKKTYKRTSYPRRSYRKKSCGCGCKSKSPSRSSTYNYAKSSYTATAAKPSPAYKRKTTQKQTAVKKQKKAPAYRYSGVKRKNTTVWA